MTVIILTTSKEKTVNKVVDWILGRNLEIKRIVEVAINSIKIVDILSGEVAFWSRVGSIYYEKAITKSINAYLKEELQNLRNFLILQLEQKPHIGNYFQHVPNKLWHLEMARKAGLGVPDTLITTHKTEARAFVHKHGSVINKSIKDSFTGTFEGVYYYNHTERVSAELIEELDEEFFPTLLQEEIPKAYELRVIFVHEAVWAGAIMSQNDPQTSLDWRNYNHQKPNRIVPYQLPTEIEAQVRQFAKLADLNTGAIDMIVSKDKRYVFLECNPNGQISMVSEKCNYPIEKYIADFLANA